MGQYIKDRKIGTCESMYYMRLSEAQELARIGARDNDGVAFAEYLKDGATRFRFPFPDEDILDGDLAGGDNDGGDIEKMQKVYNAGFSIPAGGVEVNHDRICLHNEHEGGGHGINIFIPCPYSKEFREQGIKTSTGGSGEQWLKVRYFAMRAENPQCVCTAACGAGMGHRSLTVHTIFACARCGQEQRFGADDVERIKARAREYFAVYDRTGKNDSYGGNQGLYDYAMKVIARIK